MGKSDIFARHSLTDIIASAGKAHDTLVVWQLPQDPNRLRTFWNFWHWASVADSQAAAVVAPVGNSSFGLAEEDDDESRVHRWPRTPRGS
jgi:hypothetical protein